MKESDEIESKQKVPDGNITVKPTLKNAPVVTGLQTLSCYKSIHKLLTCC
jgi:hypothetical protein